MKNNSVVIWANRPTVIKVKAHCVSINSYQKRNRRAGIRFHLDNGDVPVACYNEQTRKFEPVENPRGNAYAARNSLKYRRKDKGDFHG